MQKEIRSQFGLIAQNFIALQDLAPMIEAVAQAWIAAYRAGHKVIFCGNGGSAADAQHLAAELVGRYQLERPSMDALALTTDTSILTAIANDYGFESLFSRQIEGVGKAGDVLMAISTSGNSENVKRAMIQAKSQGLIVVALTGATGGSMRDLADFCLSVPATSANHVQEMHIAVGHLLCGLTENALYA